MMNFIYRLLFSAVNLNLSYTIYKLNFDQENNILDSGKLSHLTFCFIGAII